MNNHVAIPVKDLAESQAFYEQLGFTMYSHWEKPAQGLSAVALKNDNDVRIELVHHAGNATFQFPERPEVLHVALEVADLPSTLERCRMLGMNIVVPETKGITVKRFAFLRDPNGLAIELLEP